MKKSYLFLLFMLAVPALLKAQDYKFPALDKSPADIVYYPLKSAQDKDLSKKPLIKVIYSRPQKNGREIFGTLEKFGKVWRVGANESTEIKFYQDVQVKNEKIKAGTYSLFVIPEKDSWTIIINKQTDKWGAYTYDQSKDVARVVVPVKTSEKPIEALSITFADAQNGANMVIGWDKTIVEVPVSFK